MQQPQIDLTSTTSITTEDGVLFEQGFILRRISKFLMGGNATEDGIIPIPVFYDPKTGKILENTLPKELRNEYKDYTIQGE